MKLDILLTQKEIDRVMLDMEDKIKKLIKHCEAYPWPVSWSIEVMMDNVAMGMDSGTTIKVFDMCAKLPVHYEDAFEYAKRIFKYKLKLEASK
jgi:hypothetical protein